MINSDKYCNRLARLFIHYLEDKDQISSEQLNQIKKKMTTIKEGVDNYVPTVQEIMQVLSQLTENNKLVYYHIKKQQKLFTKL